MQAIAYTVLFVSAQLKQYVIAFLPGNFGRTSAKAQYIANINHAVRNEVRPIILMGPPFIIPAVYHSSSLPDVGCLCIVVTAMVTNTK
jgi:hypothetical protein